MEAHENIMSFFILQTIVILLDFVVSNLLFCHANCPLVLHEFYSVFVHYHLKFPYGRTAFLRTGLLNEKLP